MIRRWRGAARLMRVELFTRWSLYVVPWFVTVSVVGELAAGLRNAPPALVWSLVGLAVAQNVVAVPLLRRGLDHYLRERPMGRRLPALAAALTVAGLAAGVVLQATGGPYGAGTAIRTAVLNVGPFAMVYALLLPVRTFFAVHTGLAAVLALAEAAVHPGAAASVGTFIGVLCTSALCLFSTRCSGWMLQVMYEVDASREVQARLAVAEERLRFGRDLHDVMGRNLAVIALKSELAVQLARRERPEAVTQMVEVQRIAHETQMEVRGVVRGYREADLQVELAGARSVLRAARVDCRVDFPAEADGGPPLPEAVRSALGWVVREGTTNVLRHADAGRCAVRVRVQAGTAVLEMENDGVPTELRTGTGAGTGDGAGTGPGDGSGLKGLRERLAALGGTLESGPGDGVGTYRLRAELPLEGTA
ncbi:sensor histidine kinase [Streptomyces sp. Rer75]|uniref:sensor histidine kinase n=1 Tax=Streptomyces sp. Rer75 TaxID=2750011 RepID=UPI0015CFA449|nr:histidine kinase [Streptomyces sp. Rer75]QLH23156.1 histidine kinase [Streptomyces sp. Rer75]